MEILSIFGNIAAIVAAAYSIFAFCKEIFEVKMEAFIDATFLVLINNTGQTVLIRRIYCKRGTLYGEILGGRFMPIYGDTGKTEIYIDVTLVPRQKIEQRCTICLNGQPVESIAKVKRGNFFSKKIFDIALAPLNF